MRIPARLWWIPLALTVGGMTYLGMVRLSRLQADLRTPATAPGPVKPFVPPPPVRREPVLAQDPGVPDIAPARPAPPALPRVELPPFRPAKK
jgi:hypothetical protein